MDIGVCRLRRIGLNVLHSALHPRHGLTWTDGNSIYLVPVNITEDEVGNNSPMKLGEFDHVSSLHWSSDIGESHCYLCVVHTAVVSLWKVDGSSPKLSFKQIRKIHATPILQGCLWNPKRDVLCIMNKEQCTFYFRHLNKRGSYSLPPIDSGKITCGCWTMDGTTLIVGIKSIILVYQWVDIDHSFNDYSLIAWKIPNVHGSICTLAPLSDDRIICSVELRLEDLCKSNRSLFEMPDLTAESGTDWSLTDEDDVIKPKSAAPAGTTYTESLLHLKTHARRSSNDASKLVLFELQAENQPPRKLHSVNIPGILSPDLLHCDDFRNLIVVGSNCQNHLHIYRVLDNEFHQVQIMTLASDERPKGVCGVPVHLPVSQEGILVMIGRLQQSDPAFLPSSLDMEYTMKLCFKTLVTDEEEAFSAASTASVGRDNSLNDDPVNRGSACCLTNVTSARLSDSISCDVNAQSYGEGDSQMPLSGSQLRNRKLIPGGNFPISRVGSSPGLATAVGPLEERLRGLHFRSPSVQSSSGVESLTRMDLLLPGSSFAPTKPKAKNIEILGEAAQNSDLETERTEFFKQHASFNNTASIQRLKEEQFSLKKTKNDESDLKVNAVLKDALKPSGMTKLVGDCQYSGVYGSASSLDMSFDDNSITRSSMHQGGQRCNVGCSDVSKQLSLVEKQLTSQEIHISDLQKRVAEISRLLDETRYAGLPLFKPATKPDIVFLKYVPEDSCSKSVTKAFVLDNGKLQLNSVKEAFELSTVEIIVDGIPCVVGANVQGYMPVEFQHKDTVTISGKKVQMPSASILEQRSMANGVPASALSNVDVLRSEQDQEQTIQPDVTANHQAVSARKHPPPSSTFC